MRIFSAVLFFCAVSAAAFGHTWYYSNSIWMALEKAQQQPESGYSLKIYAEDGGFRLTEGFLDGDLQMRRTQEHKGDQITVNEENFEQQTASKLVYRNGILLSEVRTDGDSTETAKFYYSPSGELEQVTHQVNDQPPYDQYLVRFSDGALRTVFRYRDDQLLQTLTLRQDGFSMGNDDRMVRESWGDTHHMREIFSRGELTMKFEEHRDNLKRTVTETMFSPRRVSRWEYQEEMLVSRSVETAGRTEEMLFTYDDLGRVREETFIESSGTQRTVRRTAFRYHENGNIAESRITVNGELHEVTSFNPDGDPVLREIYRGGRVLVTYTYE